MKKRKVQITDHALVRWLEREHNIDMEAARETLAGIAQPFADLAVANAQVGDLWFVFQTDKLVTVSPSKPGPMSKFLNDRGPPPPRPEKLPWQALKRKRSR